MPHCVHASVGTSAPLLLLCAIRSSAAIRSPRPPEVRRRLPQRHPGHPGTRFPESCTRSHCRAGLFYVSRARDGGVRCCTDSRRPAPGLACRRGILAGIPATPESVARRCAATANATAPAFYVSPAFSRARDGGVRCCTDSRRPAPDLACRTARLYISRARDGGVRCCTDSRWPAPGLACRTARLYVSRARVGVYGVYGAGVWANVSRRTPVAPRGCTALRTDSATRKVSHAAATRSPTPRKAPAKPPVPRRAPERPRAAGSRNVRVPARRGEGCVARPARARFA